MFAHDLPKIGKRRVDDLKPHFAREARTPVVDRLRVPVEREHAAFSTQGLENPCRVPAAPERRIDIKPTRGWREEFQRLIDKHRYVLIHWNPSLRDVCQAVSPA